MLYLLDTKILILQYAVIINGRTENIKIMNEYIAVPQLYDTLENLDYDGFGDIYESISEGKYIFKMEDISLLCKLFTYNFEDIHPHQIRQIVKMTFLTVNEYDIYSALIELIKGLKMIYDKSVVEEANNKLRFTYDDFIYEYISMFINNYKSPEIELFGKLISNDKSKEFKTKITELIDKSMEFGENDYRAKGEFLSKIIK